MEFATYRDALEFGFTSDEIEEINGYFYVSTPAPVKNKYTYYKYGFTCYYFKGKEVQYKFSGIHYSTHLSKKFIAKEINSKLKKLNSHYGTSCKTLMLLEFIEEQI